MSHKKYRIACQGFFQGGWGEHLPLLGFGLPLLRNFDLKVNQFKYLKYLIVALCVINVNKSLKYCMYVHIYILAIQQPF